MLTSPQPADHEKKIAAIREEMDKDCTFKPSIITKGGASSRGPVETRLYEQVSSSA